MDGCSGEASSDPLLGPDVTDDVGSVVGALDGAVPDGGLVVASVGDLVCPAIMAAVGRDDGASVATDTVGRVGVATVVGAIV